MIAPELHTERLVLKRLTTEFSSSTYLSWMNDPEVYQYLESRGNYDMSKLERYLKDVERKEMLFWAVILKKNQKHIGNIKLDPVNSQHQRVEYGILMGDKDEWGKGYGKEASEAIFRFSFNNLSLRKITLGVVEQNIAAINLYKKMGFVQEGLLKDDVTYDGRCYNTIRMAYFNPKLYTDENS